MITTELYNGQGFGNQLWCYVTTRLLARDKGVAFGIQAPERFRGLDFMDVDFGEQVFGGHGPEGGPPAELPRGISHYYAERALYHTSGADVRMRDPGLMSVADGTKIDGCMQDCDYIMENRDQVRKWLKVRGEAECHDYSADDICVINFRGGGYVHDKNFFLRSAYWTDAVAHMRAINAAFRFVVVTDDVKTAQQFFPDFEVHHWNIAKDFTVIKNAHYLIASNSSFAQFPIILGEKLKYCIAPKYWGRHNTSDGYWSLGYSIMDGVHYLGRDGKLCDAAACRKEWAEYRAEHEGSFTPDQPAHMRTAARPHSLAHAFARALKAKAKRFVAKLASTRTGWRMKEARSERKAIKNWKSPQEIAEYRKKIKVYDVFSFFNELDLLEVRLGILDPYVDYFVLAEATQTFSGQPKPLHYEINKERYRKWQHKIIHVIIDDVPASEDDLRARLHADPASLGLTDRQIIRDSLTTGNISRDVPHWFKEFYIKESVRKGLERSGTAARDEDFCYVSDLDEIWNPARLIDYSKDDVFKLKQTGYLYYLNNRTDENDWDVWTGTVATRYANIRHDSINHIRTHRRMRDQFTYLRNGGWHFGFQGGYEGAKKKIVESAHFWYKPEETLPNLEERVRKNMHVRGNKKVRIWIDERGLPKFLIENRERYKKLFR